MPIGLVRAAFSKLRTEESRSGVEKAWQWWYQKKLTQLESEANLIRDRLLQESFAIRRSWELSLTESNQSNSSSPQQCVERLEEVSLALKEFSDRLYPPYLNEGLPFALQYLIRRWQEQLPEYQFKLNLPQKWQQKSSANSFIVLNILEDLLHLQETKISSNNNTFAKSKSRIGRRNRVYSP